ncbi:DHA2 family efflux MFS transporter permease subunit [Umezawaea tangerina]|uniref:EmrB/QacA subfamily drug resistance transporter n=1 Tax=Umezawaea tangerina TaxID=84725 RepID=A0A2T0SS47_9PSEU|nr:DHA2 family efflux MFS transporter permease subunit [Umezawaea tangerina]PRY36226.1 EmrB/QacA subfamily drug resistance transporter [Umezawaea tangerina]
MTDTTRRPADPRWLALVVLCAGMLMIVLDQTIVNVALPAIQTDLGFSQAGLAWIVNAYLIAFGGLLLLAGRLGDLIGHKRVFVLGLVVFTVASLLCGLATAPELLIGARFVQGVGGALSTAVTLGMIVRMFPEPGEQAKAIGVFSFVAAAGASIGLLLGGVLTQVLTWHWIFFVNIPIGVAAVLLATRLIPAKPGIGLGGGADVVGAVLITASVMLGVYTIVKAETHGWGSAHTLVLGAVAVALLVGFVVRQAKAVNPLLPLRVFRSRNVAGANGAQILLVAGMFGMFFLGTLYMQLVLGYDALQIGLAFLPIAVSIGALSVGFSARLNARFGEPRVLLVGMGLILVGLLVFVRAPVDGHYVEHLLPVMLPLGIGFGMSFPALMTLAMSGATPDDAGLASGLVNTTAQVGGALGLAVLATTSTSRTTALLAEGVPTPEALTSGFHLAFGISAALVALAVVVAVTVIRPIPATAEAPRPVVVH